MQDQPTSRPADVRYTQARRSLMSAYNWDLDDNYMDAMYCHTRITEPRAERRQDMLATLMGGPL